MFFSISPTEDGSIWHSMAHITWIHARRDWVEFNAPLDTIQVISEADTRKDMSFAGPHDGWLHLGGHIPKKHQKEGVVGHSQSISGKSYNVNILKINKYIWIKISHKNGIMELQKSRRGSSLMTPL